MPAEPAAEHRPEESTKAAKTAAAHQPGESTKAAKTAAAHRPVSLMKALDVVLVLDNSGSMKKNDPQALMAKVASAFADQLSDNTRLGIVVFDERAQVVLDLTEVNAEDFDQKRTEALTKLTYGGTLTDIPAGVERAVYALRVDKRPDAERIIVLVTDGIVDIGSEAFNLEQSRWLTDSLAKEARQHGIRVFGIAFTEEADYQLIQSVSQATEGAYFRVLEADHIPNLFVQIAQRISQLRQKGVKPEAPLPPPTRTEPPELAPIVVGVSPRYELWVLVGGVLLLMAIGLLSARMRARRRAVPYAQLAQVGEHAAAKPHVIHEPVTRIGRDEWANDVVIPYDTVSAQHALIEFRDGVFYVRDLQSGNGTFLNGRHFGGDTQTRELPLKNGDRIRFDAYEFEFCTGKRRSKQAERPVVEHLQKATVLRSSPQPSEAEAAPGLEDPPQRASAADDREMAFAPAAVCQGAGEAESRRSDAEMLSSTMRSEPPPPHWSSYPPADISDAETGHAPPAEESNPAEPKADASHSRSSTLQGVAPPPRLSHQRPSNS